MCYTCQLSKIWLQCRHIYSLLQCENVWIIVVLMMVTFRLHNSVQNNHTCKNSYCPESKRVFANVLQQRYDSHWDKHPGSWKKWAWCSFLNTQKQLTLFFIYLYPMPDRQDERPPLAASQKHGLSQRFPAVYHLSRSLIWLSLSHQRNTSFLPKTHRHTHFPVHTHYTKHTLTQNEMWCVLL